MAGDKMSDPLFKDWLTTREIAELELEAMPKTQRSIQLLSNSKDWQVPECVRPFKTQGGGYEYHIDLLPPVARRDLDSRREKQRAYDAIEVKKQELATVDQSVMAAGLSGIQRKVATARMGIVIHLEMMAVQRDISQRQAILTFIDELQEEIAFREKGEIGKVMDIGVFEMSQMAHHRTGSKMKVISRASLYDWIKAKAKNDFYGLAPKPTKVEQPMPEWFKTFMHFYARPQKPTIRRAYENFTRHLLDKGFEGKLPTHRQVELALGKLNKLEKSRGRMSPQALKSMQAYKVRDTSELLPTSVYTADGKTFDAEIAHPVTLNPYKPEITTIIDVHTRRIVGFSVSQKENLIAVARALRDACVNHGIPAIFYVDNGAGYTNKAFDKPMTGYLARIGITKSNSIPGHAQGKGLMERAHKTPLENIAKELPSYLGRDMDSDAALKFHRATRKEIKEFGASNKLISFEDFSLLLADEYDRYNNRPHRGLPRYKDAENNWVHLTPNEMWAKAQDDGFEAMILEDEDAQDAFRVYDVRVCSRCMLQLNKNSYYHADLERYHGEKVLVGQDFDNADYLWVREIDFDAKTGEQLAGKLICKAVFEGNSQDYYPKTYLQKSEENRADGQIKRRREKLEIAEDSKRAMMIEQQASPVMDLEIFNPEPEPVLMAVKANEQSQKEKKRIIRDDTDLANYAFECGIESLSKSQREQLAKAVNNGTSRQLLEIEGIDLKALTALFKNVA